MTHFDCCVTNTNNIVDAKCALWLSEVHNMPLYDGGDTLKTIHQSVFDKKDVLFINVDSSAPIFNMCKSKYTIRSRTINSNYQMVINVDCIEGELLLYVQKLFQEKQSGNFQDILDTPIEKLQQLVEYKRFNPTLTTFNVLVNLMHDKDSSLDKMFEEMQQKRKFQTEYVTDLIKNAKTIHLTGHYRQTTIKVIQISHDLESVILAVYNSRDGYAVLLTYKICNTNVIFTFYGFNGDIVAKIGLTAGQINPIVDTQLYELVPGLQHITRLYQMA